MHSKVKCVLPLSDCGVLNEVSDPRGFHSSAGEQRREDRSHTVLTKSAVSRRDTVLTSYLHTQEDILYNTGCRRMFGNVVVFFDEAIYLQHYTDDIAVADFPEHLRCSQRTTGHLLLDSCLTQSSLLSLSSSLAPCEVLAMPTSNQGWPEEFGFQLGGSGPSYILSVEEGSSAQLAGLQPGDQVLEIEGQNVSTLGTHAVIAIAQTQRNIPPSIGVVSRIQQVCTTTSLTLFLSPAHRCSCTLT